MLATLVSIGLLAGAAAFQDGSRPDLLIADFEGPDYGGWKAAGDAFGDAPARGAFPGQMAVAGYLGRGLVNSFRGGDGSTGELTSPPFRVERDYINFLIGGGGWENETCLDLLVDGKVARTAVGPNREPGGSERLRWDGWDVKDLQGKEAVLRVVDRRKGGWGHINVDHVVQADASRKPAELLHNLLNPKRYLHLPVRTGAPKVRVQYRLDGKRPDREFEIELADGTVDFYVFSDMAAYAKRQVVVHVDAAYDRKVYEKFVESDDVPDAAAMYRESHRPQFHFTSRRGWLNDPNGLVWKDGEYHLYYQHNPFGWAWGNMHWGHAVSPDLVRWREQPIAIYPRAWGDWAFSGSAVVDHKNTGGFQAGDKPPIVAAYTSTGRGECIVYSNDGGRTFTEFEGNPVVKHQGRDPRLFRHEPTNKWVMAVYDEEGKNPRRESIDFYTSADLKSWAFASRIDGFYECPDVFELPVDGDPNRKLWVVYAADGRYKLGEFDGKAFTPTSGPEKLATWHGDFYAAQTFSDEPKGRRVQIGWARNVTFPGSPFNQQMALPVELTLRSTQDGPRMFAEPVEELKSLRAAVRKVGRTTLEPGAKNPLDGADTNPFFFAMEDPRPARDARPPSGAKGAGDAYEIELEFRPGAAKFVELDLRGTPLIYDVDRQDVVCEKVRTFVPQVDGAVRLHVFLDRGSIEVFANRGRTAISVAALPDDANHRLGIAAKGGAVELEKLDVYPLKSAWTQSSGR